MINHSPWLWLTRLHFLIDWQHYIHTHLRQEVQFSFHYIFVPLAPNAWNDPLYEDQVAFCIQCKPWLSYLLLKPIQLFREAHTKRGLWQNKPGQTDIQNWERWVHRHDPALIQHLRLTWSPVMTNLSLRGCRAIELSHTHTSLNKTLKNKTWPNKTHVAVNLTTACRNLSHLNVQCAHTPYYSLTEKCRAIIILLQIFMSDI